MTGYLTQTLGEWMIKCNKDDNIYPLCPESKIWSEKIETKKFIKEGMEVVFDFLVIGEYSKTEEMLIKNRMVKIKKIEFDSL